MARLARWCTARRPPLRARVSPRLACARAAPRRSASSVTLGPYARPSRPQVRHVHVFDCHGMGIKHLAPSVVRRLQPTFKLGDEYYPEMVGCSVCINAPWALHSFWAIIKPTLSTDLQSRVLIASRSETPAILSRLMAPPQLPTMLHASGGTCTAMPEAVADLIGFSALTSDQLGAILVGRDAPSGGVCTALIAIDYH